MSYKKQHHYTEKEIRQIEEFHAKYMRMLHTLFMDKEWRCKNGRHKRMSVLSYCLYYRYITPDQLSTINSSERTTERVFLNRLQRSGYLFSEQSTADNVHCSLYHITPSGAGQCAEELKTLISNGALTGINEDCINYFLTRRRTEHDGRGNQAHSLGISDFNTYLMSCLDTMDYRYLPEAGIAGNGTVYSTVQRMLGNFTRPKNSLQCDALLDIPTDGNTIRIYVEQDMNTQRPGIIHNKISNYLNLSYQEEQPASRAILFSLMTQPIKSHSPKAPSSNDFEYKNYAYGRACCFVIHSLRKNGDDFGDIYMSEVLDALKKYCETEQYYTGFYRRTAEYVETLLKNGNPDMTAEEFISTIRQGYKSLITNDSREYTDSHRKAFLNRRKTILAEVNNNGKRATDAMLRGFSVYTSHSHWHGSTFPFLIPHLSSAMDRRIRLKICHIHHIRDTDNCTFSLCSDTLGKTGYILKNHYHLSGNFHLYIENISDDAGGRCRASHYLSTIRWTEERGMLLLLAADEDIKTAREIFMGSLYERAIRTPQGSKVPLSVGFMTYYAAANDLFIFSFDENGTMEEYTVPCP